jgi:hypothetical protein
MTTLTDFIGEGNYEPFTLKVFPLDKPSGEPELFTFEIEAIMLAFLNGAEAARRLGDVRYEAGLNGQVFPLF